MDNERPEGPPPRPLRALPGVPTREPTRTHVRPACRFRRETKRVPVGTLVRHPLCPRCGVRLGYKEEGGVAQFLHVFDARFRVAVVRLGGSFVETPLTPEPEPKE